MSRKIAYILFGNINLNIYILYKKFYTFIIDYIICFNNELIKLLNIFFYF